MSEASTIEDRLADMIEQARYVEVGGVRAGCEVLSLKDCAVIVRALRIVAPTLQSADFE